MNPTVHQSGSSVEGGGLAAICAALYEQTSYRNALLLLLLPAAAPYGDSHISWQQQLAARLLLYTCEEEARQLVRLVAGHQQLGV